MLSNVLKSVQGWHGGIDQRSLVPITALTASVTGKKSLQESKDLNDTTENVRNSFNMVTSWSQQDTLLVCLSCKTLPFVDFFFFFFLFSSMQMGCGWWMLKSFQVLSSTEQQLRCLSSRLCVHTSIYINISHLKCWNDWNKWMFQ